MTAVVDTADTHAPSSLRRTTVGRGVWLIAAATAAFHLATATIYGYHRDEVYYLASGRRLAWGYVDHPPLTPLLYRVSADLFGTSRFDLRIVPAVLSAVIVVLTARLAREMGAGRQGMILAAVAAAVGPMFLTLGHFLSTVDMELVLWTAAAILLVRLLNGGDARLWVAVGAVLGLAMLDKWTTSLFVVGVGAGLLAVPERRILRTPWVVVGAVVAFAVWLPNLLWQAGHGFPQFEVAANLRTPEAIATIPYQVVFFGAAGIILAIPGFLWLWRDEAGRRYRAFAIAFVVIVAMVMLSAGKPYYAGVFGPVLLAAGAASGQWSFRPALAWFVGVAVVSAPFAMPLLPLSTADATRGANKEIGEMVGWPHVVDVVQGVYRRHPGATVFAANYSEAGILELLGPARGLPQPISGHNTYWYWGHPRGRSPETIVVGTSQEYLRRWWGDVQLAATIHTPGGVHNMEDGAPVWVCRDQLADWQTLWPKLRHFQ